MSRSPSTPEQVFHRMMDRVSPEPNSGCWLFTGAPCNPFGQCRVSMQSGWVRREVLVHRLAYEVMVGPIPGELSVCHRCDVPCCVNPDHLFLGSHLENMHDKIRKGRANVPFGRRHHKAKLSDADVVEIRISPDTSHALAAKFGVTTRTINHVRAKQIWRHIEG